ncbi:MULTISPECIES: DUF934 domain-containing protein [unclassified Simplicispira]|uniref:DUF934 domain-containing protein n=1 Tax=unclassified Simplicispira TaxID=2630407 RepID=UPI000D5D5CB0|nr:MULTISPECIES: DUF934 domain-containing protein [unclassified Simplicispira]PVY56021.1 uncharacterized protein DUF934 [Simplicispira sp. 125]REG16965.1 uncharacterized protein DUF934 [Simplicispira sp. 110]
MKIIAASALFTGADTEKTLQIANDAELAELVASGALEGVQRVELQFPKFTDGRAYSQALLLRRRYKFAGDIRATGDVLIDQLVHMHRSGFSSAVLAEGVDAAAAERQFARFGAFYQGDVNEPRPLFARDAALESA